MYTNRKLSESEIKKAISFTIALEIIKLLVIQLNRQVKDLYSETSKALMEKIKESAYKGKVFCANGWEKLIW